MDDLLEWVREHVGPWGYLVLGLAAALEYIFPPFPGDTVTLFGAFLAVAGGWSPLAVWTVLTAASVAGAGIAHRIGRAFGRDTARWPKSFQTDEARAMLQRIEVALVKRGPLLFVLNRFLPAFRSVVFLAAGALSIPLPAVLLWGGISAALWNGALLGAAWAIGSSWERLRDFGEAYSQGMLLLVVAVGAIVWWRWQAAEKERAATGEDAATADDAPAQTDERG